MSVPAPEFDALWDAANSGDSQAQYQLGQHYWHQSDYGRCRRWFGKAGRAGFAPAMVQLGRQCLLGLGMTVSVADAVAHFSQAATAGDRDGLFELACLHYRGQGLARDLDETASLLHQSACLQHPGALGCYALLAAESGRTDLFDEACALAIAAGNERLLAATGGRVKAADSATLSTRAQALPALTFPQVAVDAGQALDAGATVLVFPDLLSAVECNYLIETAKPYLMPSHTVHPDSGTAVRNELRTSHGWSFHPTQEDIIIMRIKERLAAQAGLPFGQAEPFAMLRYQPGQEYREHFDFINPASGEAGREIGQRGQRVTTIFSYLATVPQGGETVFPRLTVKVAPQQGQAVMFSNVLADGSINPDSLHASLPVVEGEKWLATLWFRDRAFAP